jgi:hypothetical protein
MERVALLMKPKSSIIKLALSFIIPFVALLFLIPKFFNIELNNEIIPALAIGALFISLIINGYRKIGHQGQLPIWIGLSLIGLSGMALIFSISVNGSNPLIELDAKTQAFSLIGLGIGVLFFFVGLKTMISASYFLGSRRK